jgi:prepilin-type N-terminal cleavage/methylation domain-containing protein
MRLRKGFTLIELLVCVAIVALLLALGGAAFSGCGTSDGFREGVITKLSYKGFINKSWEGELTQDTWKARNGPDSGLSNAWDFSCLDDAVAHQMQEAPSGSRVRLHYHQVGGIQFSTSTNYRVVRVEVVGRPPQ